MDAIVRQATTEDAGLLASLVRAAFEEYRDVLVPPSGGHNETDATIAALIERGGALIAESGGAAVGCVVFEPEEGDLYFGRLSVLPEARQAGVARALIGAVEAEATRRGCPGVRIGVRLALPGNRKLFESLGYEVTGHGTHEGFEAPTFLHMGKRIR